MKRIGLISDTHSYLDPQLKDFFTDCDEIWHLGDVGDIKVIEELSKWKKTIGVYGNIDNKEVRSIFPEVLIIEENNFKFMLIHIAGSFGKYNYKVQEYLKTHSNIQCIICGHSHILKVQYDKKNKLLYINPGAAGKHGFHQIRTAMKFEVHNGSIQQLQLIELGKRSKL